MIARRQILRYGACAATSFLTPAVAQSERLRVAVGPYLPTPSDVRTAYAPFARFLSERTGREVDLTPVTEWSGVIVGLSAKRIDIAWMGPWSFILAQKESGARAIATVKYQGQPTYEALLLSRGDLQLANFPWDFKGLRLGLSDVGGTSGWLMPTWYFKSLGIDPKTFFTYRDGATHAANLVALANGQLDVASSYDRVRTELIARGVVKEDATKVVWRHRLPNDAIVVRHDLDPTLTLRITRALTDMTEQEALSILPRNYTGFAAVERETYAPIAEAGRAVGTLK